jgi:hypothetical protein
MLEFKRAIVKDVCGQKRNLELEKQVREIYNKKMHKIT